MQAPDYPWGPTGDELNAFSEKAEREWGGSFGLEERAPSMARDEHFRQWWDRFRRASASPAAAAMLQRIRNPDLPARDILLDFHLVVRESTTGTGRSR
jgi:hypothetical protein